LQFILVFNQNMVDGRIPVKCELAHKEEEYVRKAFGSFLCWLLDPFFRWWWALITGIASFLSFVWTPPTGLSIGKTGILLLSFAIFSLLFLVVSVVAQGYQLFCERYKGLEVVAIQKMAGSGTDLTFLLRGYLRDATGLLVEIRRPLEDIEVPFAIVRITSMTSKGLYQAVPVWVSAGHLRDFNSHRITANLLIARPNMYFDHIRNVFEGMATKETTNDLT